MSNVPFAAATSQLAVGSDPPVGHPMLQLHVEIACRAVNATNPRTDATARVRLKMLFVLLIG
jgi:hypothetical protein